MNLVTFIYIEDKEMTEELIAKKLSRIILLQGSKLNRSLDNRHIWILTTQICDEYRNQFIQYSWNRIGDGIKAVLGTSTSISIYLDEEKVYPKNHLKNYMYTKANELQFDFSGDDPSHDPRFL